MPVTLAQAAQNAADDIDLSVIDEFRTSRLMDLITFDDVVNPVGGGGTLTYGYRRLASLGTAAFRAVNTEYAPTEVTTTKHAVDLKVLGGAFQIDRVLANIGAAASGEVSLQMSNKIRATQAEFANAVINGDSAVDEDGFDGLSKALAGSSTEVPSGSVDWSATMDEAASYRVMDALDEALALLDGQPGAIISNKAVLAKIKGATRRAGQYVTAPGPRGTMVDSYGGISLVDAGKKAGPTNEDIIPLVDGAADLYAVRFALDGFHGVSTLGGQLVSQWLPDFTKAGAVKTGEVEMGPVGVVLKATKAAAVIRGVRVRPAA